MATLDKVMEMQQKGLSDSDITTQLRNEGISPSEISDSLNQAKIKNAVSPSEIMPPQPAESAPTAPEGMQASIMSNQKQQPVAQQPVAQQPEIPTAPEIYPPQEQTNGPQQENYYQPTPQTYSQQDYYMPQGGMDTETISEIAEQVATEKINDYKKKTGDIITFKNTIQDRVDDIDDRLKRIEKNIDKLQQAVIGKVGELGESNAMIHKDLDNLHGTVSKLMGPLIDNYNELKKISK